MSKRKIIIEPDPILRKKSTALEKVDNDLRKLMDDMLETMYSAPGIGLAAVQIGILKRVVVIDISKGEDLSPYISYAVNIAVSEQDRNEFNNMLYKALNIDIYANPELTLSNYMNRKKANWLLDNIEEYFY